MYDLKIFTDNVDPKALDQIYTLVKQPAFEGCKVRIMPDVHAGAGCVIGFTADLGDKVIPNIVGVDIGCGMLTVMLGNIDIDFGKLDEVIRERVPSGRNVHTAPLMEDYRLYDLRCARNIKDLPRIMCSIGTLGGGNHFIEVDRDEDGNKYLVIHTGSRNLGKQVAEYYQNLAIENLHGRGKLREAEQKLIAEYKAAGRQREIEAAVSALRKEFCPAGSVPKDLCYLEGADRYDYLNDMGICQRFASLNRSVIADILLLAMGWMARSSFETVHNYIELGTDLVRKGAISARKGERLLIPINMRDGCILGRGKGHPDWNYSAPHGAGRIMSRSAAKASITLDEFRDAMSGVFTTSVSEATIDESPMAYKSIDDILRFIGDTVTVDKIIKPLYNFKAAD